MARFDYSGETCNCELTRQADTDNHLVLVDPGVKRPTLKKNECCSLTAEFTPRTRLDHPNFTRNKLNRLIDADWNTTLANPSGKLLVRVTGLLLFDSYHFFHQTPHAGQQLGDTPRSKVGVLPRGRNVPS
jgi:hypothetical protein